MSSTAVDLGVACRDAFARRTAPGRALAEAGATVAGACHDMALRFAAGGTLLAFGNGEASTDAQHISVEFVHPVLVGKRALPGVSLVTDPATLTGLARSDGFDAVFSRQLETLAQPEDIALGVSPDGYCANVLRALEQGQRDGLLTLALLGGDGGPIGRSPAVAHAVTVASGDRHVVKEVQVTAYHVLWELVHVFLEHPGLGTTDVGPPATATGVEGLYPFLYEGWADVDALREQVARSTAEKAHEIADLRDVVGAAEEAPLVACAGALADAFAGGGRLLSFGNGGSSSDAQEVARCFLDPADGLRPLPARCLTDDVAVVTALANDVDFEVVFARQVEAFGRPGDVAVGLSTSGNSPNLLAAFAAARERGMTTVGFAGGGGGAMGEADTIDHLFVVPSASVHRIQEVQTTLYHVLRELTGLRLGR